MGGSKCAECLGWPGAESNLAEDAESSRHHCLVARRSLLRIPKLLQDSLLALTRDRWMLDTLRAYQRVGVDELKVPRHN
jgi:hypothetical protein